jgi:hypothetical protein
MCEQSEWLSAESAPKDRPILADFGGPIAVVAFWSGMYSKWCFAGQDYDWFVTEWADAPLLGWMNLPEVKRG